MQTEQILKEARARFAEFRNEMQEISMKATLGAGEAREAFEREWGNFSSFVDEQGNRIRRQGAWAARMTERLDQRLKRLSELVTKGKPVTQPSESLIQSFGHAGCPRSLTPDPVALFIHE
ncbi:MAG: hypothetical protein ACKOCO_13150 [Bacteroidota bacterium]